MRRLLILFSCLFVITTILISSCRKDDFPDDTPDWLKEKIRSIEKSRDCYGNVAPKIWEMQNDTSNEIVYKIHKYEGPNSYEYYKADGTFICDCGVASCGGCGSYGTFSSHWIQLRLIWEDKSDKCR